MYSKTIPFETFAHPTIIGMLHISTNTILAGSPHQKELFHLPSLTYKDIKKIKDLTIFFNQLTASLRFASDYSGVIATTKELGCFHSLLASLSFMPYLIDRTFQEISLYQKQGVTVLQLENIGAPYAIRNGVPAIEQMLLEYIAFLVCKEYPTLPLGIQVLSFADNIALEIAIRNKLFYVRAESPLFTGIRPEGVNPNQGNLHDLYYMRNVFNLLTYRQAGEFPYIFPDLLKKHTVFIQELDNVQTWLENIEFQKLEGIIITGKQTGAPADEKDLALAREYIDRLKTKIPLLSGSGATIDNLAMYLKYVNAIIVGSSIKEQGNWEQPIDETALSRFMEKFSRLTAEPMPH